MDAVCHIEVFHGETIKKLSVRPNLYHLLLDLRYTGEDRILWVDAICIDQNVIKERNHQVQQMAAIIIQTSPPCSFLARDIYARDFTCHGMAKAMEVSRAPHVDYWETCPSQSQSKSKCPYIILVSDKSSIGGGSTEYGYCRRSETRKEH